MKNIKKEVEALFNSMSDEEFDNMLNVAGIEFEDGSGKIIYRNNADLKDNSTSTVYKY